MCEGRCTGHCCERFTLPFSPEELGEHYRTKAKRSRGEKLTKPIDALGRDGVVSFSGRPQIITDIEIVTPMVIYLGLHPTDPATGKIRSKMLHHYTCKHYSKEHRMCTIYEVRPEVCRDYPHGNKCLYPGCTWTAAREGRVTREGKILTREQLDVKLQEALERGEVCLKEKAG